MDIKTVFSVAFKILTILTLTFFSVFANAKSSRQVLALSESEPRYVLAHDPDYAEFKGRLSRYLTKPAPPQNQEQALRCEQKYQELYAKSELNIPIFWGYFNSDQNINDDVYYKKLFSENITDRCLPGLVLCEFKKVGDGDPRTSTEIFERVIKNPFGKSVTVRLTLANASLTPYLWENQGNSWEQQYHRSVAIEKAYLQSLNSSDAVFYVGHARYGTGIGFRPFTTGSVPWMRAWVLQPMKYSVEQTLLQATTPPKVLAFLSCDSDSHYGKALHAANPLTALLLTRNATSFRDTQTSLFASLNSLLSGHCEEQFQTSMRIATRTFYFFAKDPKPTDLMALSPKLYNFFADDTEELADRKPLTDGFREERQIRSLYSP